jgi:recombination protein RecA
MAKKKTDDNIVDGTTLTSRVMADLHKMYGEGSAVNADKIINRKIDIISVSPALDLILHGGIPEGSFVSLIGKPKQGKTVTALTIAANCQKLGKTVYFINVEGRLKKMNLSGTKDLDTSPDKFVVIESDENNIRSSKDYLNIVEFIIKNHPGCVIIIDSLSALVDEKQLANGAGSGMPGGGQKTVAEFVANMANVVPVNKTIVIGIAHLMPTIASFMGPKSVAKVAQRWSFQSDIILQVKYIKPLKNGDKQIGQEVNWLCSCAALGGPGGIITSYIRYGVGIDAIYELMQFAINIKLISKGGAWFSLNFLEDVEEYKESQPKFQGQENLYQALLEKPEWIEVLKTKLLDYKEVLVGSESEE